MKARDHNDVQWLDNGESGSPWPPSEVEAGVWRTVFVAWPLAVTIALVVCALVFVPSAQAQSTCLHYVNSGFLIDMEGTPAEACEALRVALSSPVGVGRPAELISCTPTGTGITGVYRFQDPFDEFPHDLSAVGACASEPPASSPDTGIEWDNTNHLLQLLLIVSCVFVFTHGYSAGNRL